jgi:putative protease
VAVLALEKPLKVGDRIRIEGGETNFEQEVKSMEIDHKKVKKAKKGDPVAVLVDQKVHEGYRVYKL